MEKEAKAWDSEERRLKSVVPQNWNLQSAAGIAIAHADELRMLVAQDITSRIRDLQKKMGDADAFGKTNRGV